MLAVGVDVRTQSGCLYQGHLASL